MKSFYIRLRPYLANISWIFFDKIFSLCLAFLTTVLVSRYLGPEEYGILAYATSTTALLATISHIGLSGIIIRELVKHPTETTEILGTTFAIKSIGALLAFLILILIAFFSRQSSETEFWVLTIAACSVLFQPLQIVSFWLEAHLQAKYITIGNALGKLASVALKLSLIYVSANLIPFAFGNLLQIFIGTGVIIAFYQSVGNTSISKWTVSFNRARSLLRSGSVIFLGAVFASIYLKIDQVMLRWLIGPKEVGIYSIAATLSEVWYFLPTAIVISLFPRLIILRQANLESYRSRLQQLLDLLFIAAFFIAFLCSIFADQFVYLSFGESYLDSAGILTVHVWAGVFIFMRAALSKWILVEGVEVFSLTTQAAGAITNVVLNIFLIPNFGGFGAAVATLIAYATSSYFSLLLHPKTREIFWMMTHSMLLVPTLGARYIKKIL